MSKHKHRLINCRHMLIQVIDCACLVSKEAIFTKDNKKSGIVSYGLLFSEQSK